MPWVIFSCGGLSSVYNDRHLYWLLHNSIWSEHKPSKIAKQSHPSKLQTFGSIVTIVPSEPIILDTTYDKIVMIRWFIGGRNIRLSHIPIFICFLFSLRMNWHLLGSVESSAASLSWLSCIENGCSWPEREENSIDRGMNQSSWPYTNSF